LVHADLNELETAGLSPPMLRIRSFVRGPTRVALAPFLALALTAPTFAQSQTIPPAPQPLHGAGATFPAPVYERWATDWQAQGGAMVRYDPVGSGAGIERAKAGAVDFGASDVPLSAGDLQQSRLLQFPAVIGGVVPVANVPGIGPGRLHLDATTLSAIYRGAIRHWDDPAIAALNPHLSLPSLNITAVHRQDASGTTALFSRWLTLGDAAWRQSIGTAPTLAWPQDVNDAAGAGNEGVASLVQRTRAAIGYVEFAYARRHALSDVMLPSHEGTPVRASRASFESAVAAARWRDARDLDQSLVDEPGAASWPIVGASFILVPAAADATRRTEVLRFFRWALQHGDAAAAALDYVGLPAPARRIVDETLLRP
jgi:phosphate transport system substrate-binding protein